MVIFLSDVFLLSNYCHSSVFCTLKGNSKSTCGFAAKLSDHASWTVGFVNSIIAVIFAITTVFVGLTTSVVALKIAIWKICCRIVLIILFFHPSGIVSALLCSFLSVSRAKARDSRSYFCSKFFAITTVFVGLTTSIVALKVAIWKLCCIL